MWAIRVLSGPAAGQITPLKSGKNLLGRGPTCEVKIPSAGISKEHAQIFITEDKVLLSDLNSRNGTFVNGVRIQIQKLSPGDKILLHDVLVDALLLPDDAVLTPLRPQQQAPYQQQLPYQQQQMHQTPPGQFPPSHFPQSPYPPAWTAPDTSQAGPGVMPARQPAANPLVETYNRLVDYINNVAMPGVDHIAKMFEYRWVIAGLVALYIALVTAVTVIPTLGLIKSSVQEESQRRAKTIARNLAAINRQALIEKSEISVTTRPAEIEDGVTAALIINGRDGSIIAPANQRGSYGDKAFVARIKRSDREIVAQIDDSTVGASVPIIAFNSELRDTSPIAYAVIIYDISSIATKEGRTLSLFIQILGIAGVLGFFLYFFLIRVIEHPLVELNAQLDDALREGRDDLTTAYLFPRLSDLASNINSALARIGVDVMNEQQIIVNRDLEAANLISLMSDAAIAINALDERIIFSNHSLDHLIGGGMDLRGRMLTDIPDSSLQQNLRDLISRLRASPEQVAMSELPFAGQPFIIRGQAVIGDSGESAYYIISIRMAGEEAS